MKKILLLTSFALCSVLFTSCNKSADKEFTPALKASNNNPYNGQCGILSNMLISIEVLFNQDNEMLKTMMDYTIIGPEEGVRYIKVTKNNAAEKYIVQVMRYTDSYPAYKPSKDRIIYKGEDAKNIAFEDITNLFTTECTFIEWLVFDDVYYVEAGC